MRKVTGVWRGCKMVVNYGLGAGQKTDTVWDKMKNKKLDSVHKEISRYFEFLFDKGYKIRDSEYSPQHFGNWRVTLDSPECVIEIYCDRNELSIAFGSSDVNRKGRIGLEPMIYFLSREQNFIGSYKGNFFWGKKKQFKRLASLLKEYINQITPYFGNDFQKHEIDLMFAQNKYNLSAVERYTPNTNN